MNEIFQEESALGTFELGGPTPEEARRAYALDLAVRLYCAREHGHYSSSLGPSIRDRDVLETAGKFVEYISGGNSD